MSREHIHTCAFSKEKVNIEEEDTVMIAGSHNGILFKCYVRMDVFFERFANRPEAPAQLPGLTPYKSRRHPRIRWKFNPVRFGSTLEKWRGGPGETFNTLMKDGETGASQSSAITASIG